MTEQSQYSHMLMFALGPVQPFIMQARKTRDLWIGSLVLSKLMEAAMSGIKGQFVFPAIQTVKDIPDIPNKYVALFSSLEQAQQAAQQSKEQIKERWVAMCQTVWEKVIAIYSDQATQIIWQRQTYFDHLFEIYWAIVERQEGKNYSAWLDETESLFAARKRLRDFRPQNEPGEKSAISGEREVLRGIRTDREGLRLFWQKIARKHSSSDINQQGDERLDAIDMIKRFAIQAHAITGKGAFPSTSSIATGSFVEKLLDSDPQREAWRQWREVTAGKLASKSQDAAQDIPYLAQKASKEWQWILQRDGDLYFPAVFAPHRPEKDYDLPDSTSTIKRGKAALAALLDEADTLNITRPTPYYAIMQMDGDNMGLLLGSTRAAADHEAISAALSDFARGIAPDLVERQYPARLVYAGGDDVLAFAPLARDVTSTNRDQPLSILALADELQARYQDRVKKALSLVPPPQDGEQGQTVTASMGIAIAHHYTSLSYVLRSAREAEHAAKERYGRNALVVSILRRSGEQTQVGCHWHYPGLADDGQPIRLFSRFLTLFKDDILSPKCIYILLEEASALVGLGDAARTSEIRRVLLRQLELAQKEDKEKKALRDEIGVLAQYIVQLARKMDAGDEHEPMDSEDDLKAPLVVELHSTRRRHGIVEVLGWLLVMAFLARKVQEQE